MGGTEMGTALGTEMGWAQMGKDLRRVGHICEHFCGVHRTFTCTHCRQLSLLNGVMKSLGSFPYWN